MSKNTSFTSVKVMAPQHNTFEGLSHQVKQSMNMGYLVPNMLVETIPTDHFRINSNHLIRFMPMLAPMMHQVDIYQHFWYCPKRLLWDGFQDFITGGEFGDDAPVYPFVQYNEKFVKSSLPDYLGLPTDIPVVKGTHIDAMPFSMYAFIWNEFYRDQTLNHELDYPCIDGDNTSLFNGQNLFGKPFKRAWEQDYFTSCLPFPQRGHAVVMPLGQYADIEFKHIEAVTMLRRSDLTDGVNPGQLNAQAPGGFQTPMTDDINAKLQVDNSASLRTNLSTAVAATINDLRLSFAVQAWLELNARSGSRYTEYLQAHWNSHAGDNTLQRPIYLGGYKSPLIVSEVLQNSQTDITPQGTMAGRGISATVNDGYQVSYECKEHGYIMGIVSIMPKPAYFQGLHRMWKRFDKFDYYEPLFANLGEQAVEVGELYFKDEDIYDTATFGYQERWSEYKYMPNRVSGEFKDTLKFWTLVREFDATPALNADFIACSPSERIFAVQSIPDSNIDQVLCHFNHFIKASRPLPIYNIPALL